MKFDHAHGGSVALGFKEVMLVGGQGTNKAEMLQNGEWTEVKEYPVVSWHQTLFAKTTTIIYSFGGIDDSRQYLRNAYRYDRLADHWARMPDFPLEAIGFRVPSGARVTYKEKDVILFAGGCCQRTLANTSITAFDLSSEDLAECRGQAPDGPVLWRTGLRPWIQDLPLQGEGSTGDDGDWKWKHTLSHGGF